MISVPPGGTVTEHTVTVKGSQLKVRAIRDVSGAVVSWNLPPALEQNLNDQTRQQLYKYLLTVTSGQQQAMPVQPRPGASPMSRQVAPVPVGVPRVPARPMPTMVAPPRPLNAANTTARVIQQTAKGLTTVMPPGGAVRPVSNAAGVAPRPPPQQQQQQQPQPQPQAPAKPSVLPSQQLVSEQIKRSWEADRRAIEAPKKSKFTSLDDAIERLLPYHLVAYPDFTVEDDGGLKRKLSTTWGNCD